MPSALNIPNWNQDGLIPPYDPMNAVPVADSPYPAPLSELVDRFGTTQPRLALLRGLMSYRAMLHGAGLVRGFQWVDGSFVVDKENTIGSPPADIDVVTFFELPSGVSQRDFHAAHSAIFDRVNIKATLKIDSYFVVMDRSDLDFVVERSVYWSGFFGHTRQDQRKGFVQIDLAQQEDASVRQHVNSRLNRIVQHGP